MVDALDECQDRQNLNLVQHLKSIVENTTGGIRIIISARDSIDIVSELASNNESGGDQSSNVSLPGYTTIIEITSQKNHSDLEEYLKEDIEALSPDEKEFIVSALKWVVWAVSGITVIEISDHYREIYQRKEEEDTDAKDNDPKDLNDFIISQNMGFIEENPFQDPEIKDIIYHLESSGRDFFKFDRKTGVVGVDIAVREWIEEDSKGSNAKSTLNEAHGFRKYRDGENTIFKLILTLRALNNEFFQDKYMPRSVMIYNVSSPKLSGGSYMSERQYEFQIARNWRTTEKFPRTSIKVPETKRYEIDHWHDHVRILQAWWDESSMDDSWWSELLLELSVFIRPENWYRWRAITYKQQGYNSKDQFFEQPLHTACRLGLYLLVDFLMVDSGIKQRAEEIYPRNFNRIEAVRELRAVCFESEEVLRPPYQIGSWAYLNAMDNVELIDFLSMAAFFRDGGRFGYENPTILNFKKVIAAMDPELSVAWLVYQSLNISTVAVSALRPLFDSACGQRGEWNKEDPLIAWHPSLATDFNNFWKIAHRDKSIAATRLRLLTATKPSINPMTDSLCDIRTPTYQSPLYLAALHPETLKCLIKHGADVDSEDSNGKTYDGLGLETTDDKRKTFIVQPLLGIMVELGGRDDGWNRTSDKYLESAMTLISEGARLDLRTPEGRSLIQLAAAARKIKLFKLLCLSREWDVHEVDGDGQTILHHLLYHRVSENTSEIKETLEICELILRMRRPSGPELIDAEDKESLTPLAYAVRAGFKEGVQLLIKLGANVHDENDREENCFHRLASQSSTLSSHPENEIAIGNMLFNAGVDCTACSASYRDHRFDWRRRGDSGDRFLPLSFAVLNGSPHLIEFFLTKYCEIKIQPPQLHPLLFPHDTGDNWFHLMADSDTARWPPEILARVFGKLTATLTEYTDVAAYIATPNQYGTTALHTAIRRFRPDIIKHITAINSDITLRDFRGYNSLDFFAERTKSYLDGNRIEAKYIEAQKDILQHLIGIYADATPPFSFLETSLFEYECIETLENNFDLHQILSPFYHPRQDEHGWTICEILSADYRNHLMRYLPRNSVVSEPDAFQKPSSMDLVGYGWLKLSEDGLECFASGESK
ncbi:hypothetical protein ABW20_dc0104402 [Dactylellina cionopaga]|nr:hypothetical protein ABW20_dc0104402 [Dactylellina cionopaga]